MSDNTITVGTRVEHPRYGEGIVAGTTLASYEIFFEQGGKVEILKSNTDLTVLDEKYKVTEIQPVDMFPQTHHVENVVLLERRSNSKTCTALYYQYCNVQQQFNIFFKFVSEH